LGSWRPIAPCVIGCVPAVQRQRPGWHCRAWSKRRPLYDGGPLGSRLKRRGRRAACSPGPPGGPRPGAARESGSGSVCLHGIAFTTSSATWAKPPRLQHPTRGQRARVAQCTALRESGLDAQQRRRAWRRVRAQPVGTHPPPGRGAMDRSTVSWRQRDAWGVYVTGAIAQSLRSRRATRQQRQSRSRARAEPEARTAECRLHRQTLQRDGHNRDALLSPAHRDGCRRAQCDDTGRWTRTIIKLGSGPRPSDCPSQSAIHPGLSLAL
jgi:hypothetical protein